MNKVFLIGRLTRDPEIRYTSNNTPVASFTLAVNRNFTNQDGEREADFIGVVVWKKPAENVKEYLSQGSKVAVDGKIQTRSYENESGDKRYITEIISESIEFLDSKKKENEPSSKNENTSKKNNAKEEGNPFAEFGEQIEIIDEDLPF